MPCNMTARNITLSNWVAGGDDQIRGDDPTGALGGGGGGGNLIPTMLDGSHTYNAGAVSVTEVSETYTASVGAGDASGTTWFTSSEGRLDYVEFTGDFNVIASNAGLVTGATTNEYQFCGLAVWLSATNYEFAVAGNRGADATNTVEYKATVNAASQQDDTLTDSITLHKCDLRVQRVGSTVVFYYRRPGDTTWITIPHSGLFQRVSFGTGTVRVGLLTYGFGTVTAFTSSCDSVVATIGTAS
jgi:hypothetical protein